MQKSNINFKQIRKKVTNLAPPSQFQDSQNIPLNPAHKISFRGIKKTNTDTSNIALTPKNNNTNTYNKNDSSSSFINISLFKEPKISDIQEIVKQKKYYLSPKKIQSQKNLNINSNKINSSKGVETSRQECNKFSMLLESKGYNNSNCNSNRKKSTDLCFKNLNVNANSGTKTGFNVTFNQNSYTNSTTYLLNNSSKYRINTDRSGANVEGPQPNFDRLYINTDRINAERAHADRQRFNTQRSQYSYCLTQTDNNQSYVKKSEKIQQKCRQIKQKQYASSRQATGQLNSLNRLKSKLISPLKKKSESNPEPQVARQFERQLQKQRQKYKQMNKQRQKQMKTLREKEKQNKAQKETQKQKFVGIFQYSSILSQHDLVNMSKNNQSIDFDMSPCL